MKPKRFASQQASLDLGPALAVDQAVAEPIQPAEAPESNSNPIQDLMPVIESMNNTITSIDATLKSLVSMLEVVSAAYKARDCSGFLKRL